MFHRRRRRCPAVSGARWTRCVPISATIGVLTELAAIAGTSGRTLQRQFLSFVGKTPRAVLREIGLECARRELLQGAPGVKIMDVALRCGFPAFRAVLDRVSPPLRRDTVADAEAAGGVYGHARRDAFAVYADTGPARDGVRADRGDRGKSGDGCRYRRRARGRTDARRDFGGHGGAAGPPSSDRGDQGNGSSRPSLSSG